jgi:hypothetical protein
MTEEQYNQLLMAASVMMWLNDQSLMVQVWKN